MGVHIYGHPKLISCVTSAPETNSIMKRRKYKINKISNKLQRIRFHVNLITNVKSVGENITHNVLIGGLYMELGTKRNKT